MDLRNEKNPFGLCRFCRGDDLSALCCEAGIPELAAVRLNRLVRPPEEGELLLFPTGRFAVRSAEAGDTAASVCAACGMDGAEFALFNGAEIFPGQELLIRIKE